MASSRLTRDDRGRWVVILTTPDVDLPAGTTFLVLGNTFAAGAS